MAHLIVQDETSRYDKEMMKYGDTESLNLKSGLAAALPGANLAARFARISSDVKETTRMVQEATGHPTVSAVREAVAGLEELPRGGQLKTDIAAMRRLADAATAAKLEKSEAFIEDNANNDLRPLTRLRRHMQVLDQLEGLESMFRVWNAQAQRVTMVPLRPSDEPDDDINSLWTAVTSSGNEDSVRQTHACLERLPEWTREAEEALPVLDLVQRAGCTAEAAARIAT